LLRAASRDLLAAPSRWRAREWAVFGAFLLVTAVVCTEKWPVQALIERSDGAAARLVAESADVLGSGLATVGYGVAALVAGRLANKRGLVETALALGAGGTWCWVLTKAGQIVFAESRPKAGGAMHWMALGGHGVSGHASAAALLLWTVRGRLGTGGPLRRVATTALLGWAITIGWSRVYLGQHFLWNVMLGFAIGSFTGSVATRASTTM
jgi:membrane-associated phospholipid phosphatase